MKPRVLISYFFGRETIPLGASCAAGFRELGWDMHCFNSQEESPEELRQKVIHYLAHDQKREAIAQAGCRKVLGFESHTEKMQGLLKTIGDDFWEARQ